MKEEIEFYVSSGNVFEDMGLPDAEELQLKSSLAIEIRLAIKSKRLTRPQAALKLGISKEQTNTLLDGSPFDYSVSQLIGYLNCLDRDVTLSASVRERTWEDQKHSQPIAAVH
ncbi:MAG: helix-turn-helix domain-containing protein [Janthinobacterium lividum]